MTDAEILRSQIPTSTDPERLEREAVRAEQKDARQRGDGCRPDSIPAVSQCADDLGEGDSRRLSLGPLLTHPRVQSTPPQRKPLSTDAALEEALRHISKLTSFYMDNVLWGQACRDAREFVEKMGSTAVAVPMPPDRPSSPATSHPNAIQQNAAANAPGAYTGVSG